MDILTGVPGTGKSVFLVKLILDEFVNKNNSEFRICYANISGLKVNEAPLKGKVFWLNFNSLEICMEIEYFLFNNNKNCGNYDVEIEKVFKAIEISKTIEDFYLNVKNCNLTLSFTEEFEKKIISILGFKFWGALIIIDEFHTEYNTKKQHLIRHITYHRHFYQDLIFATQNLNLVSPAYKNLADSYYKAVQSQFRMGKKLVYDKYVSPTFNKKDRVSTVKIEPKEELFNLYKSGKNKQNKNVIYKFILIAVALIIVIVLYFKYVIIGGKIKEKEKEEKTATIEKIEQVNNQKKDEQKSVKEKIIDKTEEILNKSEEVNKKMKKIENNKVICFRCGSGGSCSYNEYIYDKDFIKGIMKIYQTDIAFKYEKNGFLQVCYNVSLDFIDLYLSDNKPQEKQMQENNNELKTIDTTMPTF